jgi:hypothetical protein
MSDEDGTRGQSKNFRRYDSQILCSRITNRYGPGRGGLPRPLLLRHRALRGLNATSLKHRNRTDVPSYDGVMSWSREFEDPIPLPLEERALWPLPPQQNMQRPMLGIPWQAPDY